jgi:uncharacterized protein
MKKINVFVVTICILFAISCGKSIIPHYEYYSNGNVKLHGYFINKKKDSIWTKYYESGKIEAIASYKEGILVGPAKGYYENGSIKTIATYKNNELSDSIFYWHPNGRLKSKGFINNRRKNGIWYYYDTTGVMIEKTIYRNDSIVEIN